MAKATKPHLGAPRAWIRDELEPSCNVSFTRIHPTHEIEIDVRTGWGGKDGDRAQHVRVRLSDAEIAKLLRFALDRGLVPADMAGGADKYVEL